MSWAPIDIGLVMGLIFAWVVLAFTVAFRLFDFPDLTIEGSMPLGASIFAGALIGGAPLWLATIAAIGGGMLAGGLTAFFSVRLGINRFLAAVIVIAMCYSASFRALGTSNVGLIDLPSLFATVGDADRAAMSTLQWRTMLLLGGLLLAGCVALALALRSRRGLRMRIAGTNPQFAEALGVPTTAMVVLALAVTNGLAAWCGALLAMFQGFVDVGMGQGILVLAIAGMALGERLVPQKRLGVLTYVLSAAVVGSVAYQLLSAWAMRFDITPTDLKFLTAAFVLLVVALRRPGAPGLADALR